MDPIARMKEILEDNDLRGNNKKYYLDQITRTLTPTHIASMIKPLVEVPYEKALSKEELLTRVYPHLNIRESANQWWKIKEALQLLRESGEVIVENQWRPVNGYRICIPTKMDRMYTVDRRIRPIMDGVKRWEHRLLSKDMAPEEIEAYHQMVERETKQKITRGNRK